MGSNGAVSGHSDDFVALLPGPNNPKLMFGRYPGVHWNRVNRFGQIVVGHRVQLVASYHMVAGIGDLQLTSNGQSRGRVVPGDHDGANARFATGADGNFGLIPGRVQHSHQAGKNQVPFFQLRYLVRGPVPVGQSQHAECPRGHLGIGLRQFSASVVG
jgi:hypothetical protein